MWKPWSKDSYNLIEVEAAKAYRCCYNSEIQLQKCHLQQYMWHNDAEASQNLPMKICFCLLPELVIAMWLCWHFSITAGACLYKDDTLRNNITSWSSLCYRYRKPSLPRNVDTSSSRKLPGNVNCDGSLQGSVHEPANDRGFPLRDSVLPEVSIHQQLEGVPDEKLSRFLWTWWEQSKLLFLPKAWKLQYIFARVNDVYV